MRMEEGKLLRPGRNAACEFSGIGIGCPFGFLLIWFLLAPQNGDAQLSPLDYWTWRNPEVSAVSLYSIAYGNGAFVAVGNWGTVLTSSDGVRWQNQSLPITTPFSRVAFGNGLFVAYGVDAPGAAHANSTSYFLTSADGDKWSIAYTEMNPSIYGRSDYIYDLIFANGMFVAVGGNNSSMEPERTAWIMTSPDGTNWSTQLSGPGQALYAVTFAHGTFVAVGDNGTSVTSSNGAAWQTGEATAFWSPSQWVDVLHVGGRFLALANTGHTTSPTHILSSTNGRQWAFEGEVTGWGGMNTLVSCGNQLLTSGEDGLTFVSSDAQTWTPLSLPVTTVVLDGQAIQGATYLVGSGGSILTTTNGTAWNTFPSAIREFTPRSMAFNGKVFVALGAAGFAFWSNDGKQWFTGSLQTNSINSVINANGNFVAVGDDHTILVSSNGQTWQTVYSNPYLDNVLKDVAWNGSLFAAVGWYGYTITSTNGFVWESHHPTGNWFGSVTAGDGLFVANQGVNICTSTNGVDWVTRTNTGGPMMRDGAYGNGRFVLVGDLGRALVSTNGVAWASAVVRSDWLLTEVLFAGDRFIAAGDGGILFSSADGFTWKQHFLPAPNRVAALAYGCDTVVVAGSDDMVLQSDSLTSPLTTIRRFEAIEGNRIRLSLVATPGTVFEVQKRTGLDKPPSSALITAPLGRTIYETERGGSEAFFQAIPWLPQ